MGHTISHTQTLKCLLRLEQVYSTTVLGNVETQTEWMRKQTPPERSLDVALATRGGGGPLPPR